MHQIKKKHFGWGYAPDHAGGAYSAPQTPNWWKGAGCLLPKNPTSLGLDGASSPDFTALAP